MAEISFDDYQDVRSFKLDLYRMQAAPQERRRRRSAKHIWFI